MLRNTTKTMMQSAVRRMSRVEQFLISARIAMGALIAFWAGYSFTSMFPGYFPQIGGLWSAISAIFVVQVSQKDTKNSSYARLICTAVGSIASGLYLSFLPFNPIGVGCTIFVSCLICAVFNMMNWMRLAALTILVSMYALSLESNMIPWLNSLLRFIESCIGTATAAFLVCVWPKIFSRKTFDYLSLLKLK